MWLEKLFTHDIRSISPRIVDLEQPILIVGMGIDTTVKNITRDVSALGKQFAKYKRSHEIPHKKIPWSFAAVSKDFDQVKGTFSYFIGDCVTRIDNVPAGLSAFEIPSQMYAVFPVRPQNRLGWPIAISSAKRYIYSIWLPESKYEPAGVIDDFEYHDERSVSKNKPEIDLYIAIKQKSL
ncbi:MAG: GyrI-like domain-containing protein [bacterium]